MLLTPRVALVLVRLPAGLDLIPRDACRGDRPRCKQQRPDRLVALVSAIASLAPFSSPARQRRDVVRRVGSELLVWHGGPCGRHLEASSARTWLLPCLTIGAIWNVLLALIQVTSSISIQLRCIPFPGRGSGAMQNPVYLGTFLAGVLGCWLFRRPADRGSRLVIAGLAVGVGLTVGRAAIASALLVAVAALAKRSKWRVAIVNLAITMAGLLASGTVVGAIHSSTRVADRVATGDGIGLRLAVWEAGVRAF